LRGKNAQKIISKTLKSILKSEGSNYLKIGDRLTPAEVPDERREFFSPLVRQNSRQGEWVMPLAD
jgi:hypothetical protein